MYRTMALVILASVASCATAWAQQRTDLRCPTWPAANPLDSTVVNVGGSPVKICYRSVPSRSESGMLNWQGLGLAELPTLHARSSLSIFGVRVGPGNYVLYPISQSGQWELAILWLADTATPLRGPAFDRAVGRVLLSAERTRSVAPTLSVRSSGEGGNVILFFDWGDTELTVALLPG